MKGLKLVVALFILVSIPITLASVPIQICGSTGEIFISSDDVYLIVTDQREVCGPLENSIFSIHAQNITFQNGDAVLIEQHTLACSENDLDTDCIDWIEFVVVTSNLRINSWDETVTIEEISLDCENIVDCKNKLTDETVVTSIFYSILDRVGSYAFIVLIIIVVIIAIIFFFFYTLYKTFKLLLKIILILAIILIGFLLWTDPSMILSFFN